MGGIWRWRGDAGGRRAARGACRGAPRGSWRGATSLELVAVGAPLEVGLLAPAELASLDALEHSGLVVRRLDGRRRTVDVAHPLHGEVVRARLSGTRREAIQRRLADAVESRDARRARGRAAARRVAAGGRRRGEPSCSSAPPPMRWRPSTSRAPSASPVPPATGSARDWRWGGRWLAPAVPRRPRPCWSLSPQGRTRSARH